MSMRRKMVIGMAAVVAILVGITVLGLLVGETPPRDARPSQPADVDAVPPAIVRNVGYYPPVLNIEIDLGEGERNGQLVTRAGAAILKIGRDMIAGKPIVSGNVESINMTVLGPPADDGSVGRKIIRATFRDQALRQLANAGVDADNIINYADEVGTWSPSNNDILRDYCPTHTSAKICETM